MVVFLLDNIRVINACFIVATNWSLRLVGTRGNIAVKILLYKFLVLKIYCIEFWDTQ